MSVLSELLKRENWRIWLKGLLSAGISGGATGLAGALTIPNPSFGNLFWVVVIAGAAGFAMYLKKSPMPEF